MHLYHGSSVGGLKTLLPFQADHKKPYVYFSTSEICACFYAVNPVGRPYYWFPYGFDPNGKPVYTETYPNALFDTYAGRPGFLYHCETAETQLLRFPGNPSTRLSAEPVGVQRVEAIPDLFAWFRAREQEGRLAVQRYESLTPAALAAWNGMVLEELRGADGAPAPDHAFAKFVQAKMPALWERFLLELG